MSKSNHLPISYIEWISTPRWEKQTRSNCIMFETWDEHIGIFSVFIHTTYYPHAVLTQARIITTQQYDNNAPEPKHEIDHPNASLDSICFPLTSFPISPFTLPSLVFSPLSMFRDLNSPHHEATHASSYTHLFPPVFITHLITFLFSALVLLTYWLTNIISSLHTFYSSFWSALSSSNAFILLFPANPLFVTIFHTIDSRVGCF